MIPMKVKYNKDYLETQKGEKIVNLLAAIGVADKCEGKLIVVFSRDGSDITQEFFWVDKFTLEEVKQALDMAFGYCTQEEIDALKTEEFE